MKYHIYVILGNDKRCVAEHYTTTSQEDFDDATEYFPYDVVDCDDTHIWFDGGDK